MCAKKVFLEKIIFGENCAEKLKTKNEIIGSIKT
jgi:hypothetical protein